ncbi:MAG: hypothetical protein OXN18_03215 [Gemmatimonadota bacterium]|nr:hypothetical protein [Gemmatimonadota bacterium]
MAKRHPTFSHQTLLDRIRSLTKCPADEASFDTWISARGHLALLAQNSREEDELIVYVAAKSFFVDTAIVPRAELTQSDQTDLLQWSSHPGPVASYSTSFDNGPFTIVRGNSFHGSKLLAAATRLVYPRKLVGLKTDDSYYMEVFQEYLHLSECHWRPERGAYCRFDDNGDFDPIISVSVKEAGVTLVSFSREDLEEYLAASDSLLVRFFDFTLTRPDCLDWPDFAPPAVHDSNPELVFKQRIFPGFGSWARGYQFAHLCPRDEVWARQRERWVGGGAEEGVEFWAEDLRNGTTTRISTRSGGTVNYFNGEGTTLPHELSPAYFRPEVLNKYTTDPDKYTVENRSIHCRGAWTLRGYGVNDAGQVSAYICYLSNLPYQEQLYWQSFNEKPKAGLPDDIVRPDFHGQWPSSDPPLSRVEYVLRGWNREAPSWWKVRKQRVLDALRVPRGDSSQEWASAFQALATAVVEGFLARPIRGLLAAKGVEFRKEDRSITLLERAIAAANTADTQGDSTRLEGLREAQSIRSKVAAHAGGSEAETLKGDALRDYGTFAGHFEAVCDGIANELAAVDDALKLLSQV